MIRRAQRTTTIAIRTELGREEEDDDEEEQEGKKKVEKKKKHTVGKEGDDRK